MITNFEKLTQAEFDSLKDALVQITVLIAGADGRIDQSETDWADKLTEIRGYAHKEDLREFYDEAHINFSERLKQAIESLPANTEERNEVLTNALSGLNPILAKLDHKIAFHLYNSYRSFAEHIAKASGGFLRFMAVSEAEQKWTPLSMIDPILPIDEEEENEVTKN